jgi:superfamily I DNA/RNA helicase
VGVVQLIAPAGSGKTAVLVERVRELRRRGVPAGAIACVTFNRAAKTELGERLVAGGVGDVRALTFHGLGVMILKRAKIAREHIGEPTLGQWRRLAALAKRAAGDDGVWLDPGHAKACLSDIKLGLLMNAAEYAASVDGGAQAMAALYAAYEELQREEDGMDFDDLILGSLQLLRDDRRQRERWKQQWECLLVDEYQDIEPAQELLLRILAAPHDQLFCVGDEDQTLYAFRRASVERIICLDMLYPALQRIALEINYRCPAAVVTASARLIAHNSVRFPKRIDVAPGRADPGTITLLAIKIQIDAAADVARTLGGARRGEIVVLARTTNALRPVALACADAGARPSERPPRDARYGHRAGACDPVVRDHSGIIFRGAATTRDSDCCVLQALRDAGGGTRTPDTRIMISRLRKIYAEKAPEYRHFRRVASGCIG